VVEPDVRCLSYGGLRKRFSQDYLGDERTAYQSAMARIMVWSICAFCTCMHDVVRFLIKVQYLYPIWNP
jgi:hypothetical protein